MASVVEAGGNHLMFMGLTGAMLPGAMQQITLHLMMDTRFW